MSQEDNEIVDLTMTDGEDFDEEIINPQKQDGLPTSQGTIVPIPDETPQPPSPAAEPVIAQAPLSIQEQRQTIRDLSGPVKEGDTLYVIPDAWFHAFMEQELEHYDDAKAKLGPINTHGILTTGDLFCDREHTPLRALSPAQFEKLYHWYGMAPGCRPVTTYAINNESGEIVPEYVKPMFYLHHLVTESSHDRSHHMHSRYAQVPIFSMSTLHPLSFLVQRAIQVLDEQQHLSKDPSFGEKRFRVWVIVDDNMDKLEYEVTASTFINLSQKFLIKKEHMATQLRETNLLIAHLCIEEKYSPKATRSSKKDKIESYWPSNYFIHFPPTPSNGCIGLQNLGNTCYMNSALQCLVHVPELAHYFLFNCYQAELNADNPLGMSGKVALSFANLIRQLFEKKSNRGTSYSPRDFKSTIGYFNDMFSGYHQQDSQEFLAFLLDGLHEDLNRIIDKPIVTKPEMNDHDDARNMEKVAELAKKSWEQYKLRNDSMINDLFVGLYKSTLVCPVCDKISITFDPFSDLTLPLPVEDVWHGKILLLLETGTIKSFEVELEKTSTYHTLRSYVAEKLSLNADDLFSVEIWSCQFYRNLESAESQSAYLPISDLISDNDQIVMYEVRHSEGDLIVPVLSTCLPPSNMPSPFGIPFFISLTPEECKSFGTIRQKLEHRYEQLSTFHYFSKVRANQEGKKFTIKDFPSLSQEDGYESDVSLANPEISGDYAFKIKLFDSSREVKTRGRRNRYKIGVHGSQPSEEAEEKLWTPMTNNNFTNLPELLDLLDDKKKTLYTYAKKLDMDSSTESGELLTPTSDKETIDLEDDQNSDDIAANAVSALSTTDDLKSSSENSTPDMEIEPLTSSLMFTDARDTIESDSTPASDTQVPPVEDIKDKVLIGKHTALVCEWTPDMFDTFFVGLEGEGEDGKETWSSPEVIINEEVEESKRQRELKKNEKLTLDQCLKLFSKPEVLSEQDLWYCSNCKEHRQATKQIQIWSTPDILTIHLKRFQNQRSFSDKIDAVVDFPIEGLDMSPYLASTVEAKDGAIYDLFAVDNHYGGIGGGHYTAYVKNFVDNKWYYYNDSNVTATNPEQSISGAAYLLFYRRRCDTFLGGEKFAKMLEKARVEYEEAEKRQLENDEKFYRENHESEDSDDDSDDEEEEDGDSDTAESVSDEFEPISEEVKVKHVSAPMVSTEIDDDSSDNVSSIPVGTDDEDDQSAQRRKQRLISRGKSSSLEGRAQLFSDPAVVQSDVDSPGGVIVPGSPLSVNSDDACSLYSSGVNAPSTLS